MKQKESFGLDYERYALGKLLYKIANKYSIRSVLEVPALGVKAMPSIYSLGFGKANCKITLVNPYEQGEKIWNELGYNVDFKKGIDIHNLPFEDNSFDFVWNFYTLSMNKEYNKQIDEMIRVSSNYVAFVFVNGYNVGSPVHRFLHKYKKISWTHGDKRFLFPYFVVNLLKEKNLDIIKLGVVDTPPWPDTIGFRDIRLHRMNLNVEDIEWETNTLKYLKEENYPLWIKFIYLFEKIPMFRPVKYLYSHLYYVIVKKKNERPISKKGIFF